MHMLSRHNSLVSLWNTRKCVQISSSIPKLLLNFHQRMQNQNKQLGWFCCPFCSVGACSTPGLLEQTAPVLTICLCSQQCIFNPLQQVLKGKARHVRMRHNHLRLFISNHTTAGLFTVGQAETEKRLSLPWFRSLGSGACTLLWFAFCIEGRTWRWWLGKLRCNIDPDLQRRRKGKVADLLQYNSDMHSTSQDTAQVRLPGSGCEPVSYGITALAALWEKGALDHLVASGPARGSFLLWRPSQAALNYATTFLRGPSSHQPEVSPAQDTPAHVRPFWLSRHTRSSLAALWHVPAPLRGEWPSAVCIHSADEV